METPSKVIYNKEDYKKLQKEFGEQISQIKILENTKQYYEHVFSLLEKVININNVNYDTKTLFVEIDQLSKKITIHGKE